MQKKLREFMVLMLEALHIIMDEVDLESVEAENEWYELESSIQKLIHKLKEEDSRGGKDGHQDGI